MNNIVHIVGQLDASSGEVITPRTMRVGTFSQHTADTLPPDQNALQHLQAVFPQATEPDLRAALGTLDIKGKLLTCPMGVGTLAMISISLAHIWLHFQALSGGQKARICIALATFAAPHMLLLDEPTNHLDMATIGSLCDAISTFSGTVIVISHNRDLIQVSIYTLG